MNKNNKRRPTKIDLGKVEKLFNEIDDANRLCDGNIFILSGAEKLFAEAKKRKGKR